MTPFLSRLLFPFFNIHSLSEEKTHLRGGFIFFFAVEGKGRASVLDAVDFVIKSRMSSRVRDVAVLSRARPDCCEDDTSGGESCDVFAFIHFIKLLSPLVATIGGQALN